MENVSDIYELSPMQEGMLFHTLYAPHSGIYFERCSCVLDGNLNPSAFRQAWQSVVDRHPVLRSAFYWEELEKPLQVVQREAELPWIEEDWRGADPEAQKRKWNDFLRADQERGFLLTEAPLMRCALARVADDRWCFAWCHHHLLMDGWCVPIVWGEVLDFYARWDAGPGGNGETPSRTRSPAQADGRTGAAPAGSYRDYIAWLQNRDQGAAKIFWRNELAGFSAPTPLIGARAPEHEREAQGVVYREEDLRLSAEATEALQGLARSYRLSVAGIVQGAWAILLSRYSSEEEVVFGVTVTVRPPELAGVEAMVGLFINTLPVRVRVAPAKTVAGWLQELLTAGGRREEFGYSALIDIQKWSDLPGGAPLFESLVVFENYPVEASAQQIPGLEIRDLEIFHRTNYPLTLVALPGLQLWLRISYDASRFERSAIRRMLGHLENLLAGMAAQPGERLGSLSMVTAEERAALLRASGLGGNNEMRSPSPQPSPPGEGGAFETLGNEPGGLLPLPAQRRGERAGGEGFVSSGPEGASSPRPSPPLRRGEGESSLRGCLNSMAEPEASPGGEGGRSRGSRGLSPSRSREGAPSREVAPLLHRRFEAQAAETPAAVALVFHGREFSYDEINRRANQLARHLRKRGVGPESLVGIYLERSPAVVIGILAVLKAGGGFVPIDPAYPAERVLFQLEDAQATVVLSAESLVEKLPIEGTPIVAVDADAGEIAAHEAGNLDVWVDPENTAYVIYTSGSTGKPKGVVVTHHHATRLFEATRAWFHFNSRDVWTLFHSVAFDFSVWELWGALLHGGRLVLVPFETSRAPDEFYQLVLDEGVTVLNQTPSAFTPFMEADRASDRRGDLKLRYVIFGGEALDLRALRGWFERHGDAAPALVNMYGITETTVHVTYRRLTAADAELPASLIGRPIPDLQVYLLDVQGDLAPIGVRGEIFVGGAGLARGYLRRPELAAQAFLPNPFSQEPGARLYRTGDLGCRLENGELEYCGRRDGQVKLRGFRIELGEIESALSEHPMVREAVVTLREDEPGRRELVACVVWAEQPPGALESDATAGLRAFARERLPDYMVPSFFIPIPAVPLTAHGKIDRGALPRPEVNVRRAEARAVLPRNEVERRIADIWEEVLQLEEVGVDDNFFELGGHSLLAIRVHSKLKEHFQVSMVELFRFPTIHSLAAHLSRNDPEDPEDHGHDEAAARKSRRALRPDRRHFRADLR